HRELTPITNKLCFDARGHLTIQNILAPQLTVLTKCQAQSTSDHDNLALAYKAAEVQGRNKARAFMRYILNRIMPTKSVCTYDHMYKSAQLACLDVQSFFEERQSNTEKNIL